MCGEASGEVGMVLGMCASIEHGNRGSVGGSGGVEVRRRQQRGCQRRLRTSSGCKWEQLLSAI